MPPACRLDNELYRAELIRARGALLTPFLNRYICIGHERELWPSASFDVHAIDIAVLFTTYFYSAYAEEFFNSIFDNTNVVPPAKFDSTDLDVLLTANSAMDLPPICIDLSSACNGDCFPYKFE